MRLLTLGLVALGLLAVAVVYYVFLALQPAHLASLVPGDFTFGLFYSSVDDLRALYEGPYMRRDADPGALRVGRRANVPGLDGMSQRSPAGSYFRGEQEIILAPIVDADAFEDAFESEREDITLRSPERLAQNYMGLSAAGGIPGRGRDNRLVLRATEFPLALAGRPGDADTVRRMFQYMLVFEPRHKPQGVPLLLGAAGRLPDAAGAFLARECDDFLLGLKRAEDPNAFVDGVLEATLAGDGALRRGTALASTLDLAGLARSFPHDTGVLAGGVLDAEGWRALGLALPLGDAALVAGIIETKHRARRFTLLLAARPRDNEDLVRLAHAGPALLAGGDELSFKALDDRGIEVRTAQLDGPPAAWETVLRSAAKVPPPVYLSTAVVGDVWYCALGSQALQVVRHSLGCLRGATELGVTGPRGGAKDHPGFGEGRPLALAFVTPEGLQAFRLPMPLFEIANLGQPKVVSLALYAKDGRATGDLRITR